MKKKNKQDLISFTVVYHKRSNKAIWDEKIVKAKDMAEAIRKFEAENPSCEVRGVRAPA
jgi:hypothetical protein